MIVGFYCSKLKKLVTFEQCLRCKYRTDSCPSKYLVEYWVNEGKKHRKLDLSSNVIFPSTDLGCARKVILGRVLGEYLGNLRAFRSILIGTALHKLMEEKDTDNEKLLIEDSFSYKYDDYTIAGRIDGYNIKEKLVYDWKFTGTLKYLPRQKNIYQLGLYKKIIDDYMGKFDIKSFELRYINFNSHFEEKDFKYDGKELDTITDYVENRLVNLIDAFEQAKSGILVEGEKGDECNYCPFKDVCLVGNNLENVVNITKKMRKDIILKDEQVEID